MRSLLVLSALGCHAESPALTVFTAASMESAVRDIAGSDVRINAAASSALAKQIESGAPADLFISADREWADHVAAKVKIREQKVIASNRLVLIARKEDSRSSAELLSLRLALADPSHAPAGKYAQATLQNMGHWNEGRIAAAADVRAALALVERGEADGGIIYRTDALSSKKVRIAAELECPVPIEYIAVLIDERAGALFDRLTATEGRRVFDGLGFLPP
jgi:molybdate transport system substrate-binding protein